MSLPIEETWRPVLGFEGMYEVSDQGNVRSLDRLIPDGLGGLRPLRGRPLKTQINRSNGRRQVDLRFGDGRKRRTVYTLVLEAFVGPRPPGADACHNDGDCRNDTLANLRWDSRRANNLDSVQHGVNFNSAKTHCPRNHRLASPNLVANRLARGHRSCKACHRGKGDQAESDIQYARIMKEEP